jgi:DNA-binding winged helix-turn-helix (wHTH) protein
MKESEGRKIRVRMISPCAGMNDSLKERPAYPTITVFQGGMREEWCDYKNADNTCNAPELGGDKFGAKTNCEVFSSVDVRTEKSEPNIECQTPIGRLVFNPEAHEILVSPHLAAGHEPVRVPRAEALILEALMENQGRVVSRRHLVEAYIEVPTKWDYESRAIDVFIRRLRVHLGAGRENPKDQIIQTIRSSGYRIPTDTNPDV